MVEDDLVTRFHALNNSGSEFSEVAADTAALNDGSGVLNDAETQEKLMAEILAAGEERRKAGLLSYNLLKGDYPITDTTPYPPLPKNPVKANRAKRTHLLPQS